MIANVSVIEPSNINSDETDRGVKFSLKFKDPLPISKVLSKSNSPKPKSSQTLPEDEEASGLNMLNSICKRKKRKRKNIIDSDNLHNSSLTVEAKVDVTAESLKTSESEVNLDVKNEFVDRKPEIDTKELNLRNTTETSLNQPNIVVEKKLDEFEDDGLFRRRDNSRQRYNSSDDESNFNKSTKHDPEYAHSRRSSVSSSKNDESAKVFNAYSRDKGFYYDNSLTNDSKNSTPASDSSKFKFTKNNRILHIDTYRPNNTRDSKFTSRPQTYSEKKKRGASPELKHRRSKSPPNYSSSRGKYSSSRSSTPSKSTSQSSNNFNHKRPVPSRILIIGIEGSNDSIFKDNNVIQIVERSRQQSDSGSSYRRESVVEIVERKYPRRSDGLKRSDTPSIDLTPNIIEHTQTVSESEVFERIATENSDVRESNFLVDETDLNTHSSCNVSEKSAALSITDSNTTAAMDDCEVPKSLNVGNECARSNVSSSPSDTHCSVVPFTIESEDETCVISPDKSANVKKILSNTSTQDSHSRLYSMLWQKFNPVITIIRLKNSSIVEGKLLGFDKRQNLLLYEATEMFYQRTTKEKIDDVNVDPAARPEQDEFAMELDDADAFALIDNFYTTPKPHVPSIEQKIELFSPYPYLDVNEKCEYRSKERIFEEKELCERKIGNIVINGKEVLNISIK